MKNTFLKTILFGLVCFTSNLASAQAPKLPHYSEKPSARFAPYFLGGFIRASIERTNVSKRPCASFDMKAELESLHQGFVREFKYDFETNTGLKIAQLKVKSAWKGKKWIDLRDETPDQSWTLAQGEMKMSMTVAGGTELLVRLTSRGGKKDPNPYMGLMSEYARLNLGFSQIPVYDGLGNRDASKEVCEINSQLESVEVLNAKTGRLVYRQD